MGGTPEQRFRHIESCVDYKSYVYAIDPAVTPARFLAICRQLQTLGRTREERMGVVYVRGPWGFFVIPRHGYPNLRVSFFYDTPTKEISDVLASICAAFEPTNAAYAQGDLHE